MNAVKYGDRSFKYVDICVVFIYRVFINTGCKFYI